jgi:multiple sugar transport system substrate-binding protein
MIEAAARGTLSRRTLLRTGAIAAGVTCSTGLVAACGGSGLTNPDAPASGGAADTSGSVTWSNAANPGEVERFKQFSSDYQTKHGNKITYQTVTGDYPTKIMTQLAGGKAPDAFYANDALQAKLIDSKSILDLSEYLAGAEAEVDLETIYPNLLKLMQRGEAIYGLPVDCNPKVFWFNKDLLAEAGVATNPAQLQEAGRWDRAALDDLLTKVKSTGKRAMIIQSNWFDLLGLITALGGNAIADDGKVIFDDDAPSLEIIEWMLDRIRAGLITYGGTLPEGQGADALFYGSQLATIQSGRWILPNLKKTSLQYDIAPMPSASGGDIAPTAVRSACLVVNAKTKHPGAAAKFLARFVNADGQRFRLSGGGNAVPTMPGLEDVVTESNLPEHGAWFTEVAAAGYSIPQALLAQPDAVANLGTALDKLFKDLPDHKTFAAKAAAAMNGTA